MKQGIYEMFLLDKSCSSVITKILKKVGDRSRGRPEGSIFNATPFLGLLHYNLDTHLILLRVKQGGIQHHFKVFGIIRHGIEPSSLGPLLNTLSTSPMSWFKILCYLYLYEKCRFNFVSFSPYGNQIHF